MTRLLKQTTSALPLLTALVVLVLGLQAQTTKPAPPTPIDKKKAELGGTPWNPEWDRNHREGIARRDALFASASGRPSILPAVL